MIILAFDLAWTGPTGWALWDDEVGVHLLNSGTFKPPKSGNIQATTISLYGLVAGVIAAHKPDLVAYEYPDWSAGRDNYEREIIARPALARAETVLFLAARHTDVMRLGANQVKAGIGAKSKADVGYWLAQTFQNFMTLDGGTVYVQGKALTDHEVDACAVAFVVSNDLQFKARVEASKEGQHVR